MPSVDFANDKMKKQNEMFAFDRQSLKFILLLLSFSLSSFPKRLDVFQKSTKNYHRRLKSSNLNVK